MKDDKNYEIENTYIRGCNKNIHHLLMISATCKSIYFFNVRLFTDNKNGKIVK